MAGEAAAAMTIVFSQLKRHLISLRTKDALAVKTAAAVRLGRPSTLPLELVVEVVAFHRAGFSMAAIAWDYSDRGAPTARGGGSGNPPLLEQSSTGRTPRASHCAALN